MSQLMDAGGFFPLIYDELRRLAARQLAGEQAGHTLDPTGLVHEAYLRLGNAAFAETSEFMGAAVEIMRRILVDHARSKRAAKRGGSARRYSLTETDLASVSDPDTLLDIDEALTRLALEDATAAEVARFHLFAAISIEETAQALGISRATAYRNWSYARAWLTAHLATRDQEPGKTQRR